MRFRYITTRWLEHPLIAFFLLLALSLFLVNLLSKPNNNLIGKADGMTMANIESNTLTAVYNPFSELATQIVQLHQVSDKTGYSYEVLYALWQCESNLRHDNVWGTAGEYGAFQWKLSSFKYYADKLGEALNIFSFPDQAYLTAKVLQEGGYNNWSCWNQIKIQ